MSPIQDCIKKKSTNINPIWLMRQAGRYLPEFRNIRLKNTDFISKSIIRLPFHNKLKKSDIKKVTNFIKKFFEDLR